MEIRSIIRCTDFDDIIWGSDLNWEPADHFIRTPRLLSLVKRCGVVERGDNRSRHCPIWVELELGALPVKTKSRKWIPKRPD